MNIPGFARVLWDVHTEYRVDSLTPENCRQKDVAATIADVFPRGNSPFSLLPPGSSVEGRPVPLIRFGSGPRSVLLWSQMHGDESTATLAIMDMLSFFSGGGLSRVGMADLPRRCSLYFIPILNPDGAERQMRQTAPGIDMNRDARRFSTPEARFLREAHRLTSPSFGFNLHDQELSTVGDSSAITAIALLAPAADGQRKIPTHRRRAMQVASVIAHALEPLARGRLGSYNDAFEPRAFGDMMQSWGTSTVLVESGHWKGDPGKNTVRRLNFVGLLSAIRAIASGSCTKAGVARYRRLVPNGKRAYDIIVRGATVVHGNYQVRADIGLQLEKKPGTPVTRVREIGDLHEFGAIFSISGRDVTIDSKMVRIDAPLSLRHLRKAFRKAHSALPPALS